MHHAYSLFFSQKVCNYFQNRSNCHELCKDCLSNWCEYWKLLSVSFSALLWNSFMCSPTFVYQERFISKHCQLHWKALHVYLYLLMSSNFQVVLRQNLSKKWNLRFHCANHYYHSTAANAIFSFFCSTEELYFWRAEFPRLILQLANNTRSRSLNILAFGGMLLGSLHDLQ